jgi:hypothetical protein
MESQSQTENTPLKKGLTTPDAPKKPLKEGGNLQELDEVKKQIVFEE